MRIRHALLASLATLAVATSCATGEGGDVAADPTGPPPSQSSSPSAPATGDPAPTPEQPAGPVLQVVIDGDSVSPNGELVELAVGETLTIQFDSDRAGELHVHAKPEQYVEFPAGTSTQEIVVEVPGSAEIEDHDTGDVVAQLQVR